MRLLNEDADTSFSRLTLLLTKAEASELRDTLESILRSPSAHDHVPSEDYEKEITVAIYDEPNVSAFNERCRRLIRTDQ
jgi:hypothetical protein